MKIYAGNLTPETTAAQLTEAFAAHGTVERSRLATDRDSGAPKGFGFVEMLNDAEANAAIAALDGSQLNGQAIKVSEARQKPATAATN